MRKPGVSWRPCRRSLFVAGVLVLAGCGAPSEPVPVELGQPVRMGEFLLRASTVDVRRNLNYGIADRLTVTFVLSGGNRFERMEFLGRVSRQGVYVRTEAGWREPFALQDSGDEQDQPRLFAELPVGSRGLTVEISNPYGSPESFVVDLGQ